MSIPNMALNHQLFGANIKLEKEKNKATITEFFLKKQISLW